MHGGEAFVPAQSCWCWRILKLKIWWEGRSRITTRQGDTWQRFISNKALLRRNAITRRELDVLKQVWMLNPVAHPEHFVFILNTIRLAAQD
jgi:hypothetical protein